MIQLHKYVVWASQQTTQRMNVKLIRKKLNIAKTDDIFVFLSKQRK